MGRFAEKLWTPLPAGFGLVLLLACLPGLRQDQAFAAGIQVQGRLVTSSGPVEGGTVSAWPSADFNGSPAAVSPPTGEDGKYAIDLPPGAWYLVATAGDLWSWCGQNPVTVPREEEPWIGFVMEAWKEPAYSDLEDSEYDGALSGTVLLDGAPAQKVTVTLYFDSSDGFRGMGFLRSPPTGPDGRFRLDNVPGGSYYVIARKRGSGMGVGPVMKGDLVSYYRYNPVKVAPGSAVDVTMALSIKRQDKDINAISPLTGQPGFTGTVAGRTGDPVPGVHVFAYREPEMGHHKPAALSSVTDEKGRYTITLPGPGRYYVGARDGYGDNPAPGELFGHYQGSPDHSLVLEEGQALEGVDIIVERVLAP